MTGSRFARGRVQGGRAPGRTRAEDEEPAVPRGGLGHVEGLGDAGFEGRRAGRPGVPRRYSIPGRVVDAVRSHPARRPGAVPGTARLGPPGQTDLPQVRTEWMRNLRPNITFRLSRRSIQRIILARFESGNFRLAEINPPTAIRLLAKAFGRGGREAILVGLAAVALFLAIAISSYHRGDPSWSVRNGSEHVVNRGGVVGAWISDLLLQLLGHVAWILPILLMATGIVLFVYREHPSTRLVRTTRGIGFAMVLMAACGVATLHYGDAGTLPEGVGAGGILGAVVGHAFFAAFNFLGATVVMLGMLLVGWALLTRVSG